MRFWTWPGKPAGSTHVVSSARLGKKPPTVQIDAGAYFVRDNAITIMLDKVPELSRVGGSTAIVDDSEQVYLIIARTGENEYAVASSQCTHRERPLTYDHEARLLRCSSGKAAFRLDGSIVKGPTDVPLRIYLPHVEQGRLTISVPS